MTRNGSARGRAEHFWSDWRFTVANGMEQVAGLLEGHDQVGRGRGA